MRKQTPGPADLSDGISLQSVMLQFCLMGAIFYLWSSPLIQPVKIMVVLFHEMSHGLVAILTGGKVLKILITADEGGACETEGGLPLAIVSAGYLGSMFFGAIILYLSRFKFFVPIVFGVLTLVVLSAMVTVLGDSYSKTFAGAMAAAFVVAGFLLPASLGGLALRIVGTVSCIYSIFDIYWDVLAQRGPEEIQNDAVVFSDLSGIPSQSVGMAWLICAVIFFLFALRASLRMSPEEIEEVQKGGVVF